MNERTKHLLVTVRIADKTVEYIKFKTNKNFKLHSDMLTIEFNSFQLRHDMYTGDVMHVLDKDYDN